MAILATGSLIHWNYFLALEDDLRQVARYIEFAQNNFDTYSIELAHLLLAAASEVDVIMKLLCDLKDPTVKHKNIDDYRKTSQQHLADLVVEKCTIPRFGITLNPWDQWQSAGEKNPIWWGAYNKVKHQRDQNFGEASLKNVLNAMAALAIVNLYLQKASLDPSGAILMKDVTRTLEPESSLIKFEGNDYYYFRLIG